MLFIKNPCTCIEIVLLRILKRSELMYDRFNNTHEENVITNALYDLWAVKVYDCTFRSSLSLKFLEVKRKQ